MHHATRGGVSIRSALSALAAFGRALHESSFRVMTEPAEEIDMFIRSEATVTSPRNVVWACCSATDGSAPGRKWMRTRWLAFAFVATIPAPCGEEC